MAIEMGLFDMIAEDDSPKTAFELAVLSGAEKLLVGKSSAFLLDHLS